MISLALTIILGLVGAVALFTSQTGPGIAFLILATLLYQFAKVELECADAKRRDRFMMNYEKAELRSNRHLSS